MKSIKLMAIYAVLLALMAGLLPATGIHATSVPFLSGMTSWWPFEGTAKDVIGENDGTLIGGARFGAGKTRQGVRLDGIDDFVDFGTSADLNFGIGDFSIDLWVNFADTAGEQVIIEKYIETEDAGTRTGWSLVKLSNNTLRFGGAGGEYLAAIVEATDPGITAGAWHHFAVTRSGDAFAMYFNGTAIATGNAETTINIDSTASLKLGHRGNPVDTPGSVDNRGFFLNGAADEVKVFHRALGEVEIQALASEATCICLIKQYPLAYTGQKVTLTGQYRGWEYGHGSPPITRSDWVLQDATGSIYVNGASKLKHPRDIGKPVQVSGTVRIKGGVPYIEVPKK